MTSRLYALGAKPREELRAEIDARKALRIRLCERQQWACWYCAAVMTEGNGRNQATVDHKEPQWKGDEHRDNPANLVAACRQCNEAKGPIPEVLFVRSRNDPILLDRYYRRHMARAERAFAANPKLSGKGDR